MTSNYLVTGVSGSGKTAVARELTAAWLPGFDAELIAAGAVVVDAAPLAEVVDARTAPRPTCRG